MVNRVALGQLANGSYGLEISKPGYNVLDPALEIKNLIFTSRWGHAGTVLKSGSVNGSGVNNSSGTLGTNLLGPATTIYFDSALDYVPAALVYLATDPPGRRVMVYIVYTYPFTLYRAYNYPAYTVYNDRIDIYRDNLATSEVIRYNILRIPGAQ